MEGLLTSRLAILARVHNPGLWPGAVSGPAPRRALRGCVPRAALTETQQLHPYRDNMDTKGRRPAIPGRPFVKRETHPPRSGAVLAPARPPVWVQLLGYGELRGGAGRGAGQSRDAAATVPGPAPLLGAGPARAVLARAVAALRFALQVPSAPAGPPPPLVICLLCLRAPGPGDARGSPGRRPSPARGADRAPCRRERGGAPRGPLYPSAFAAWSSFPCFPGLPSLRPAARLRGAPPACAARRAGRAPCPT